MKKLIFIKHVTDQRRVAEQLAAEGAVEKKVHETLRSSSSSSRPLSSRSQTQSSPGRHASKRPRGAKSNAAGPSTNDAIKPIYTMREFPPEVELSPDLPLLYRRFPVPSYWEVKSSDSRHPGGTYNRPRWPLDLYTPRFVKGRGTEKVGMCPVCIEPVERGGIGRAIWLIMKFSAFKCYHMQYVHGISAITGRPFSPPIAFRQVPIEVKGRKDKLQIQEGKCHKCEKWIQVEGLKEKGIKVREIFWWKHAASCHKNSVIQEDLEYYEKDEIYERLKDLDAE